MIKFFKTNECVEVQVNPNVCGLVYTLKINCSDKVYGELLRRQLESELDRLVVGIRKEEYELGYKHGRARVGKKGWFSDIFNTGYAS